MKTEKALSYSFVHGYINKPLKCLELKTVFKYLKTKTYFGLAVGFNGNNIKFQFL
jgi:hypothetical protein